MNIKIKEQQTELIQTESKYVMRDGIKYFFKQQEAINHGLAQSPKQNILFKYGMYQFATTTSNISLIENINKSDYPMFFEICNTRVKLFADIEKYKLSNYEIIKQFKNFLVDVFDEYNKTCEEYFDFDKKKCLFMVDNSKKKSMHFIYDDACFPYNGNIENRNNSQYAFWNYAKTLLMNNKDKYKDLIIWDDQGCSNGDKFSIVTSIIDFSVYSKNRAMRIMYNYKSDKSERMFCPITLDHKNKKCILSKDILSEKYLISNYRNHDLSLNHDDQFLGIKVPETKKLKNDRYNITNIYKIIEEKLDNVVIHDKRDSLIELRNDGDRTCLISGEIDKSDNCFVVIRKSGLYFQCHDVDCQDTPTDDIIDEYDKEDGYCFHRFDTPKINIKVKTNLSENEEYFFNDMNSLLPTLQTEFKDNKFVLTQESRDTFIDFINKTVVYTFNCGKPYFYCKEKILDPRNGSVVFMYNKRSTESIYRLDYYFNSTCPYWNDKDVKPYKIGSIINQLVSKMIIKVYTKTTLQPFFKNPPLLEKGTFNEWQGFTMEKYKDEEIDNLEYNTVKDRFEKSLTYKHITDHMCDGDEELIDWTMKYEAHSLQYPEDKLESCRIFYSQGGAGKDLYCKFKINMMGSRYCIVSNGLKVISSNFNSMVKGSLLIVCNEVDTKSSHKNHDNLKHLITQDYDIIEPKGVDSDKYPCFKRIIINTNYRDIIKVEPDDRRFVYYQWCNDQIGDFDFFNKLYKEINDKMFLKLAFRYFTEMDISNYNPRKIPKTKYKKSQITQNLRSTIRFLIEIINQDSDSCIMNKIKLYDLSDASDGEEEEDDLSDASDEDTNFQENSVEELHIKSTDLKNIYDIFCENEGLKALKPSIFKQDMIDLGLQDKRFRPSCCSYNRKKLIRGYKINIKDIKTRLNKKYKLELV